MRRLTSGIVSGLLLICWVASIGAAEVSKGAAAARKEAAKADKIIFWGGGEVPTSLFKRFSEMADDGSVGIVTSETGGSNIRGLIKDDSHLNGEAVQFIAPGAENLADQIGSFKTTWIDLPTLTTPSPVIDHLLISKGFLQKSPPMELLSQLKDHPGLVGLGVAPGTALVAEGRFLDVDGAADVVFCLPASVTKPDLRPVKFERLKTGKRADLVALNRAAAARRGPAFPPDEPEAPVVASGTLMPCGGGDFSDDVWKRFVELAGGVDAPIVVIPIATPEPNDQTPKGYVQLKSVGCTNLTVLNQRTKADVESPEFVSALKKAKGIWFVGGRQWKYIDAYEGTSAPQLFRDVLARGGVIAGSSAGAAIQSQYMVRGDPLGNKDIMAEGYEQGLGFLPGTAIDIHVTQRGRLSDINELIHTFPQLLGIAMDEGTAGEIHGSIMTVLGAGHVTIVDAHAGSELSLKAGDKYDLAKRKQLETPKTD